MAGREGEEVMTEASAESCSFVWDENSQLYFHASSGFYHDPVAGWYYSSRDGHYYAYENGNYVLLESHKYEERREQDAAEQATNEDTCSTEDNPPPPSEWLEETLINLYLTGYSSKKHNSDHSLETPRENSEGSVDYSEQQKYESTTGSLSASNFSLISKNEEEMGKISDEMQGIPDHVGSTCDVDNSLEEEIWKAQYGQPVETAEVQEMPVFPVVELWDWSMVREDEKARLVGRLLRQSKKLHPSLPAGSSMLKTATIRKVHFDLVQVASGKIYRLRSPSAGYLSSKLTYDASNPTKDWGFPAFTGGDFSASTVSRASKDEALHSKGSSPSIFSKNYTEYRDRAAERRACHGGYGIGPGQKGILSEGDDEVPLDLGSISNSMSFGPGSYARRILETMGWQEGEALGKTNKGLLEPIQPIGNRGNAGLGWNRFSEIL